MTLNGKELKPFTILVCKKCGRKFLPCDFMHTKVSENECGSYAVFLCPHDHGQVVPKEEG